MVKGSTQKSIYAISMSLWAPVCGQDKTSLQVRLNEHISNIRKGFKKHSVCKHYDMKHDRDPLNTLFVGIDKYRPQWRRKLSSERERDFQTGDGLDL